MTYAEAHHAKMNTPIVLDYLQPVTVQLGSVVYAKHCASCHGPNLGGQADWHQRDQDGYLPAPPMMRRATPGTIEIKTFLR